MTTNLSIFKKALLALLLPISTSLSAQQKASVHIKVSDNDKMIDTVIEFSDLTDLKKINDVVSAITGEDIDVDIHKKENNKMVWSSDDDMDFDFDFQLDSSMKSIQLKLKDLDMKKVDDLSDSMLLKYNMHVDSMNHFVFSHDDDVYATWVTDSAKGEHVFVFDNDTLFSGSDSVFHLSDEDFDVIFGEYYDGKDRKDIIMEFNHDEDLIKLKSKIRNDEGSGEDKDIYIKKYKHGKNKLIELEIETYDDGKDIE